MKTKISFMIVMMMAATVSGVVSGAPNDKDQIRARSEQRFPQIRQLKTEGKIGETSEGTIEAVKAGGDESMQKLIDAENADRAALYKLIAAEQHITVEVVAQHAAERNFEHAHKGDFLKDHGQWRQK